jgi:Flp pilus assembly protein CpaB
MKPKAMILMGIAIACGLGASYMTSRLLADRSDADQETVEVLVAKRNLSIGERITKPEELFEKKTILKEMDTPDTIKDLDALKGKILKQSRNKGDTITPNSTFNEKDNLDIPEGHQAVGLRVNLETSAHGLATLPHSRVDLIWFQRAERPEDARIDVLLQDVLVLAADGKIDRDGLTAVAQVVVLALTREQVLAVNFAKETGNLSLSLRSPGDKNKEPVAGFYGREFRDRKVPEIAKKQAAEATSQNEPPPVAKVEPKQPPKEIAKEQPKVTPPVVVDEGPKGTPHTLEIINGTHIQRITTMLDENNRPIGQQPPRPPAPAPAAGGKSADL